MANPAPFSTSWRASLALAYAHRNGRTTLVDRRHDGPLVVQKPLYPDATGRCETVIVHPPGGIAGGDALAIEVDADARCEVLLTTPGATRWYKAGTVRAGGALQDVRLRARTGALVEWLPLESIVFDEADARSAIEVDIDPGACVAGWDVVVFGRRAMGERFVRGRFRQSLVVRCDGALEWMEFGDVAGGDPLFASRAGYAGHGVAGMLWVAGGPAFDATDAARDAVTSAANGVIGGITRPAGRVVVARALGNSGEQVKQWLTRIWHCWRPRYAQGVVAAPRVWAT